jgi:hypothetical protein
MTTLEMEKPVMITTAVCSSAGWRRANKNLAYHWPSGLSQNFWKIADPGISFKGKGERRGKASVVSTAQKFMFQLEARVGPFILRPWAFGRS